MINMRPTTGALGNIQMMIEYNNIYDFLSKNIRHENTKKITISNERERKKLRVSI